jgi:hypothetical protein
MAEMSYVYFIAFDNVEDEIAKARNDNYARIRLVNLTALERRIRQLHRPIKQARYHTGARRRILFADVRVNLFEVVERRTSYANLHLP